MSLVSQGSAKGIKFFECEFEHLESDDSGVSKDRFEILAYAVGCTLRGHLRVPGEIFVEYIDIVRV